MANLANVYDHIFSNMKDGICIIDLSGSVVYMNDSAINILKADLVCSISGCKLIDLIPAREENDDFLQLIIDAVYNKGETREAIVSFKRDDTDYCNLKVNISYTLNTEDPGIIIIITDLTELFKTHKAFIRYTSADIADIVLNTPDGAELGGKNKEVTILMSDLRGFTSISTKMSPQDLITMVNHYFSVMSNIIEKYHGTIIEFLGDGIFAVFGAPKDDENHAANAVACAVEMQLASAQINEWNSNCGFPELETGVGINSGIAVVGNIGSYNRTKYGCLGEIVNIAGRTEALTTGGQIVITENTRNLIDEELVILSEDRLKPKGAGHEIGVFHIGGIAGDYGLFLAKEVYDYSPLKTPLQINFSIIENKTVLPEVYEANILEISHRYALIKSDYQLPKSSNILLNIGGDLYAKIVEANDSGCVACFTSVPDSFESWINGLSLL